MALHPALQQLTDSNRGPVVVVCSLIFIILALATVVTRVLIKLRVTRKFAVDDCLILLATCFGFAQTAALIVACNHGLGRHRDDIGATEFQVYSKATYAADILLLPTLAFAKASIACLIKGLHPPKNTIILCHVTLAVVVAWVLSSTLATAFQCGLPAPWNLNGKCIDLFAVDVYNSIMNILTDIVLIVIPSLLMLGVQVSTKKRLLVISLFASRSIVVAFSITAIVTRRHAFETSGDLTWDLINSTLWIQGMLAASIMTACLPSIRRFLSDLKTGMMGVHISEPLEQTIRTSSFSTEHRQSKDVTQLQRTASKYGSQRISVAQLADLQLDFRPGKEQFNPGRDVRNTTIVQRSEYIKPLRDNIIVQTIDYEVEYQDSIEDDVTPTQRSTKSSSPSIGPLRKKESQ